RKPDFHWRGDPSGRKIVAPSVNVGGHSMKLTSTKAVLALTFALVGSQAVHAEQYRTVAANSAETCQSGTKTEGTLEGPDDVAIASAQGDTVNATVCPGAGSVLHVQWAAGGTWKNSGNLSGGCAEILGVSEIKVRAISTNFHETATYSACLQE